MIDKLNNLNLNCNIFSVYDFNSLSQLEILCKFFEKINALIENVNNVNDLIKWLMSEGLEQEVAHQLQVWLADGTIEKLINETIFNDLNNKVNGCLKSSLSDYINVLQFGVKGDGITDDTQALQDIFKIASNKTVYFPNTGNFYKITDSINLLDETRIVSNGTLKFTEDANKPMFIISGKRFIEVEGGIYDQKGASLSGHNGYESSIFYITGSSKISIKNATFREICGRQAIGFKSSTDLELINCKFYRMTYCGVLCYEETENILLDGCEFDTVTTLTELNAYTFATGASDYTTNFNFLTRNVKIVNSVFKNNPRWEGIDSHGVVNMTVDNCYIDNCKTGIFLGFDARPKVPFEFGNIIVTNNTIVNGVNGGNGIVIQGGDNLNGELGNNVNISNNTIKGYGNSGGAYNGSIRVDNLRNLTISNNNIEDSRGYVFCGSSLINFEIIGNRCFGFVGVDNFISRLYVACWNGKVNNNIIKSKSGIFERGFYNTSKGFVEFKDNIIDAKINYHTKCSLNDGALSPTRVGKQGTFVYNNNGDTVYSCNDTIIRSTSQTLPYSCSVSNGVVTCGGNSMYDICEGEEILINGEKCVCVEHISNKIFKIDDTGINISNVNIQLQDSSWSLVGNKYTDSKLDGLITTTSQKTISVTPITNNTIKRIVFKVDDFTISYTDSITVNYFSIPPGIQVTHYNSINDNSLVFIIANISNDISSTFDLSFRITKIKQLQ